MDEAHAIELVRQNLIDSKKREEKLNLELLDAQHKARESNQRATYFRTKFQELDDALEAEEAKTNDERLAKEEAEERARQHQNEILKARRNEATANEHCDAAETEIIRLQQDLSTEQTTTNALRENLHLSRNSEMTAYDLLHINRAKVTGLQKELDAATERIRKLEAHAGRLEETIHEHETRQQPTEEDHTFGVPQKELERFEHIPSDSWKEYTSLESRDQSRRALLSVIKDSGALDAGLPALPAPVIIRPQRATTSVCNVVPFQDSIEMLPESKAKSKQVFRKCPWKFSFESLNILLQRAGRR